MKCTVRRCTGSLVSANPEPEVTVYFSGSVENINSYGTTPY